MSSANEAADALPSSFDMGGLSNAFSNPKQAFQMLDKNGDGRVTKDDLQILLQQFGINGMAAKILSKYIFKQLDANNNGTIEPSDLTHANGILSSLMKMKQGGGGHHWSIDMHIEHKPDLFFCWIIEIKSNYSEFFS